MPLPGRPWNNRVGNWSDLAADFYRTAFHYPGVAEDLEQQGFPEGTQDLEKHGNFEKR